MKKDNRVPIAIFGFIFCLQVSVSAANTIDSMLEKVLADFFAGVSEKTTVKLGNFTYADTGMGSGFSAYIADKLKIAIERSAGFSLFEEEQLEAMIETMKLNMSGLFDEETAVEIGKIQGARAILSGRFYETKLGIDLFIGLVDIESGALAESAEISLPKADIPFSVSVLPDNYNNALKVLEELKSLQETQPSDFRVKVWIERGEGGIYRDGEELEILFFSNQDCFIKLYHIDVNGKMSLIFPNQFYPDNHIKAETLYTIPDKNYPFAFVLGEPYGVEFVKVIASKVQFDDIEGAFEELGRASRAILTRGLKVSARDNAVSEFLVRYTIIE